MKIVLIIILNAIGICAIAQTKELKKINDERILRAVDTLLYTLEPLPEELGVITIEFAKIEFQRIKKAVPDKEFGTVIDVTDFYTCDLIVSFEKNLISFKDCPSYHIIYKSRDVFIYSGVEQFVGTDPKAVKAFRNKIKDKFSQPGVTHYTKSMLFHLDKDNLIFQNRNWRD